MPICRAIGVASIVIHPPRGGNAAVSAANSDRPVSRDELLAKVWGYARNLDIETRTVDIHIAKLRRKIEPDPAKPRYLVTVRGAGYRLVVE